MTIVRVIRKFYCRQSEEELGQNIDQFWIEHEIFCSRKVSLQTTDDPTEYLSDDGDVSGTEDGIAFQDKNRLGGKILAVWERYKPLLEHYCSRAGYMLSVDVKTYAHANVSVLYIYVNYHVILLQYIIIKRI